MSIYLQLDELQNEALFKIKGIFSDKEEVKEQAYSVMSEFKNLLAVAKTLSKTDEDHLTYQIYVDKLADLKVRLREAQVRSRAAANTTIHKQRIDEYCQKEKSLEDAKEELFRGSNQGKNVSETGINKLSGQTQLLEKNKAITASLQATRQMMSTSIMHTELNIDTIDQQSKDLGQLNDKFSDFNDLLTRSRAIVQFIQKQDRSDKNRIYMSLGFLAAVCFWVIWRRILKLPVYFMLWSLLKVFRIFTWLLPAGLSELLIPPIGAEVSSSSMMRIGTTSASSSTSTTVLASAAVSSVTSVVSALVSSIDLENEYAMSIDESSEIETWEDIVSQATELVRDEL